MHSFDAKIPSISSDLRKESVIAIKSAHRLQFLTLVSGTLFKQEGALQKAGQRPAP
jgi:hypothetical protein